MNTLQSLFSPSTNRKLKVLANTVLTILGILLMGSCHTMQKSHSKKKQTETIQLNNGAKWPVNAEMKPHIENGEALLAAYIAQKEQDYQKLAADLKAQNNLLIKSCTMKGQSHEELHKWLYPHIQLIERLAAAKNIIEAEELIPQCQKSYTLYKAYFQ